MDDVARMQAKFNKDQSHKFFVDGIGNEQGVQLKEDVKEKGETAFDEVELDFETDERGTSNDKIKITRATFTSPVRDYFPEKHLGVGEVEVVMPRTALGESQTKGIVVLAQMMGDMGFLAEPRRGDASSIS